MTLLNASLAAAGLACVAIPIIIHLLMNRRRKPVMWGAMRFLLEAYKRHQRRLILEKWLLLAARCLLVAAVALALGKPLLGSLIAGSGGHHVFILLDNSLASQSRAVGSPTSLDAHKAAAKALISSLRDRAARFGGEPDRVALITLAGPADGAVMPPSSDLGALADLIDSVPALDARADIPGALAMVSAALAGSTQSGAQPAASPIDPARTIVIVLSDLAEGSLDLSPTGDSLGATRLPPSVRLLVSEPASVDALPANVSIVGVEPLRSMLIGAAAEQGGDMIRVQLRRSGAGLNSALTTTVRAELRVIEPGGSPSAPAAPAPSPSDRVTVRWTPGVDTASTVVPLTTDAATARALRAGASAPPGVMVVSIDPDSVAGDNRWFRPVDVRPALRVGVVAPSQFGRAERADRLDPAAWVRLALAPTGDRGTSDIEIIDIEPAALDPGRLIGLDALVLSRPDSLGDSAWARVSAFADSGGLVLVFPPPNLTVHLWGDALARAFGSGWTLAREPRALESPAHPSPTLPRSSASSSASGLLSLIESELPDLVSPVSVRRTLPLTSTPESGRAVLALDDSSPLVFAAPPERPAAPAPRTPASSEPAGRGLVIYFAVALDLDWTDLPAKPFMVPLLQELVRQGVGQARGSWWSIAGARPAAPARTAELAPVPALSATDADRAAPDLPTVRIDAAGLASAPIRARSVYRALDATGQSRGLVAVNPDPRAGRLTTQPRDAAGQFFASLFGLSGAAGVSTAPITWLSSSPSAALATGPGPAQSLPASGAIAAMLGSSDRGSPVWLFFLIAALVLALAESFLARWASHATLDAPSGPGSPAGALASPRSGSEANP